MNENEKRIKGLQKELKRLRRLEKNKQKPFVPKEGEDFFWYDEFGNIHTEKYVDIVPQRMKVDLGVVEGTRKEAQYRVNFLRAVRKANLLISKMNDGWTPDWSNEKEKKFTLGRDDDKFIVVERKIELAPTVLLYFKNSADAFKFTKEKAKVRLLRTIFSEGKLQ